LANLLLYYKNPLNGEERYVVELNVEVKKKVIRSDNSYIEKLEELLELVDEAIPLIGSER